jgi:biotin transport system ATP-binding protein
MRHDTRFEGTLPPPGARAAAPEPIALRDVALSRDGRTVFRDLSLDLAERRIGVIGRNGSGKSQLLRLIAGLAAPDGGRVRIGLVDPAVDRRAAIRAIGLLFQNPDHQIIFPTVREELSFGLRALGLDPHAVRARADAMLGRFGRGDWAERNVQTLSQGQRHLLCLMAVLAMDPATILLDEPFSGLDLAASLRLRHVLDGLPQRLVHVTHDLDALAGYDRVIWIDGGRIAADGAPAAVVAAYGAAMRLRARDADTDV